MMLHELCHLLHHNRSPKFYTTLNRHMSRWRAIKEKLDNMAEAVFRICCAAVNSPLSRGHALLTMFNSLPFGSG